MNGYLKLALRLEEKAMPLKREHPRRANLLALAQAARMIGLEQVTPDFQFQQETGSFAKRAHVSMEMAKSLSDGDPEKAALRAAAVRAMIHSALAGPSPSVPENMKAV